MVASCCSRQYKTPASVPHPSGAVLYKCLTELQLTQGALPAEGNLGVVNLREQAAQLMGLTAESDLLRRCRSYSQYQLSCMQAVPGDVLWRWSPCLQSDGTVTTLPAHLRAPPTWASSLE